MWGSFFDRGKTDSLDAIAKGVNMNWDHILGAIISAIVTVILHQTPWGQKVFTFLQGLPKGDDTNDKLS